MPIPALYAMAVAVILGIGFAGGYNLSSKISAGSIKQCELDKSSMLLAAQEKANARMQDAEQSAQKAFAYAMNRIIDAEQQAEELRNEAKTYTTGRDCLSTDARRVLEQSKAFKNERLSEDTGSADTATAGTAEDTRDRATTDADIVEWIATASSLYEQCRGRVEAIREWDIGLDGRLIDHGSD